MENHLCLMHTRMTSEFGIVHAIFQKVISDNIVIAALELFTSFDNN